MKSEQALSDRLSCESRGGHFTDRIIINVACNTSHDTLQTLIFARAHAEDVRQGALAGARLRFIFNCIDRQYELSESAQSRLMPPHINRAIRARSQLLGRENFGCSDQDGSCWPHLRCWRHGQRCEELQTFLQIFRGVLHLNADADNLVGRSAGARPLRVNLLQSV